jgi:hypothetical protein
VVQEREELEDGACGRGKEEEGQGRGEEVGSGEMRRLCGGDGDGEIGRDGSAEFTLVVVLPQHWTPSAAVTISPIAPCNLVSRTTSVLARVFSVPLES